MGKVYLVGAGPGAPDLLTLRAARLLEAAGIVFHDALVHPHTLALAKDARLVDVGKRKGGQPPGTGLINRSSGEGARGNAVVVRLKGGDPMIFGRAREVLDALSEAGVEAAVVFGVTSSLAASASLRASLTRRGTARHVAFVTPCVGNGEAQSDWLDVALAADTVVFYMASQQARRIAAALIAGGRAPDTPVRMVENASLDGERRIETSLGALLLDDPPTFEGPAVMLVGEVLRDAAADNGVEAAVHSAPSRVALRA